MDKPGLRARTWDPHTVTLPVACAGEGWLLALAKWCRNMLFVGGCAHTGGYHAIDHAGFDEASLGGPCFDADEDTGAAEGSEVVLSWSMTEGVRRLLLATEV